MSESLRLGRIAGVPVGAHWSFVAIFSVLTVGLAAGRFPETRPDQGTAAYVAVGLAAATLFAVSVLAHEVAHAAAARRAGIAVEGIVLWALGGVTRLDRRPATPGAQFAVAIAGPAASAALGVLFGVGFLASDGSGLVALVLDGIRWLAVVNLVIAAINLIPAAPLDGGQVLAAALWRISAEREASIERAAAAGRLVGFLLVGVGLVRFATSGSSGLWFVLLGWFLIAAARVGDDPANGTGARGAVKVEQVMSPDPVTVRSDLPVEALVDARSVGDGYAGYPVVDASGELAGLVTLEQAAEVPVDSRGSTVVSSVATPIGEVPIAHLGEQVIDVVDRLGRRPGGRSSRRVLVLDDDLRLVGILTPADLLHGVEAPPLAVYPGRASARHEPGEVDE